MRGTNIIRGVTSHEGDNYNKRSNLSWGGQFSIILLLISIHLKYGLIKFLKRSGLSWEWPYKRGTTVSGYLVPHSFIFSCKFSSTQICRFAHVVTCIKRSPFSCPVIDNFIWIEPLSRDHLSYKATFSLFQRWPLNTGLTVLVLIIHCDKFLFLYLSSDTIYMY